MQHVEALEQIKNALLKGVGPPSNELEAERLICQFVPKARVNSHPDTDGSSDPQREAFLTGFCDRLFAATQELEGHFQRLDDVYADLFTFHVRPQPDQTIINTCQTVQRFLQRFPRQPLGLPGLENLPDSCLDDEFDSECDHSTNLPHSPLVCPRLKVTTRHNTNVLRLIIFREIYQHQGSDGVEEKQLVDLTAELLHKCSVVEGSHEGQDQATSCRWLLVRSFLWASWQRAQMLYFYRILYFRVMQGQYTGLGSLTVFRSTLVAPGLTIQQFSDLVAFEGKSAYMCSWAFNLLRTDSIAVGSDFRLLHCRFNQLLGHNEARCNSNSDESCDGSQLGNCERSHMDVEDQSMHDRACKGGCPRLVWDEQSYRSVKGGRAVAASWNDETDYQNRLLKFTAASDKTLAISHAWAHGQGGRPSTGLNQCLHIRYVQLAHHHDCDSYFLDTACIPEGHDLRTEAITNINQTFKQSRMTLVVDKDLLTVDVTQMTTELQECLLAAILVSDWNVRAWTILEAMKGRRNIHILCSNARSVSYREIVQAVASRGRLDIAIYALVAEHLLSWTADSGRWGDEVGLTEPSLERARELLSYRPASRLGDHLIVWSLMINDVDMLAKDAEEFWHRQKGKTVATGFLVSSADRVGTKGLSWAPNAPHAAPRDSSMPQNGSCEDKAARKFFRAFTGEESEPAEIHERGIFAEWCVHEFAGGVKECIKTTVNKALRRSSPDKDQDSRIGRELNSIRLKHLGLSRYGAIVQPKSSNRPGPWTLHRHIADYSGGVKGTLVVVLGSDGSDSMQYHGSQPYNPYRWEWKGVHEWPADVELPNFEDKVLWIS